MRISTNEPEAAKQKVPWWSYLWDYEPGRSKEERAFVQKLDCFLLTMLSLGWFIKYLDQTNMSNAFVSGMKEQLSMNSNEINLVDTAWTVGYVIGQLPSQIVVSKVRPSIWVPSCELVWSILTFCLAAAKTSNHVIVIRFFVGLAESIFYPAAHTILGAWYKPSELGKRAAIFYTASAAASMFSGYLQAAVYNGLNGVRGMAGWQWLFIMDGLISAPIAIAGFFILPDLPEITKAFYLTDKDRDLARKRMLQVGRAPRSKLGRTAFKRILGRWHVYVLTLSYSVFIMQGPSSAVNPMSLWLKSKGLPVSTINIIPTAANAIQLVMSIVLSFISDGIGHRGRIICVTIVFGLLSNLPLAIWQIPDGLKWFAFIFQRAYTPFSPLIMTWTNEICGSDAEERAVVIGAMNSIAFAFNAFVPLLTFPQVDAPRFKKGYISASCMFTFQFFIIGAIAHFYKRDSRKKEVASQDEDNTEARTLE
ncbi:hypothetical protein SLS57_005689 [Botryosphaeria dothidea]